MYKCMNSRHQSTRPTNQMCLKYCTICTKTNICGYMTCEQCKFQWCNTCNANIEQSLYIYNVCPNCRFPFPIIINHYLDSDELYATTFSFICHCIISITIEAILCYLYIQLPSSKILDVIFLLCYQLLLFTPALLIFILSQ